MIEIPHFKAPM